MIIRIDNELKHEEVFANGNELASIMGKDRVDGKRVYKYPPEKEEFAYRFDNPVLLTNSHKISMLPPTLRETLLALFASRPRIVEYDGVSITWDSKHNTVWCPSIDTILFAKTLREIFKNRTDFKLALEIGCGSGYLSKYILSKLSGLEHMIINDINPDAIGCAQDNINDSRAGYYTGDGFKKLDEQKYDLVISNPPYIPRPGEIADNPYEGIGLLKYMLENTSKFLNTGGLLVTNISNLSWDLVIDEKVKSKVKILNRLEVPLKVNNVLNNPQWIEYLKSVGLKCGMRDGYEYWQEIFIAAIEN